jgi:hypothetical protein
MTFKIFPLHTLIRKVHIICHAHAINSNEANGLPRPVTPDSNHIYSTLLYSPLSTVRMKAGRRTANMIRFFMFKSKYNTIIEV